MFAFDDKKRSTNQVVKYTVIVMFAISTAHIVSRVHSTLCLFICIRLITLPLSSHQAGTIRWVSYRSSPKLDHSILMICVLIGL